ncbi:MAG: UvrB/UvrC motif-containing protein [bacterium]|nr:UvrB/UvrC motif-containing protein [bacterium]
MFDLFDDFFSDFLEGFEPYGTPQTQVYRSSKTCPGCGRTWNDFRNTGRFGCSKCYETFRPEVSAAIRQIHSTTRHTGKVPSNAGKGLQRKREYEALQQQLKEAVKNEDYETAAKLHKQIRAMEKEGI